MGVGGIGRRFLAVAALITTAAGFAAPAHAEEPIEPETLRRRNADIIGGTALAVFAYGSRKWWDEGYSGDFRTQGEGWFGADTYAGGADKLGHAYSAYVGARALTAALGWAGNDERNALRLATWTTLGVFTGIEVLDGYSKEYRFSAEDVIANAAGVGLAVLLESSPRLDRLVDLRVHYLPSGEGGTRKFDPFGDYSGQTYLLALKAAGVPALAGHPLLRYLELSFGYNARGFDTGPDAPGERSRNLYFGITLNLSEVLRATAYRDLPPSSWARRATDGVLEVVQVPGTGVFTRHRF